MSYTSSYTSSSHHRRACSIGGGGKARTAAAAGAVAAAEVFERADTAECATYGFATTAYGFLTVRKVEFARVAAGGAATEPLT